MACRAQRVTKTAPNDHEGRKTIAVAAANRILTPLAPNAAMHATTDPIVAAASAFAFGRPLVVNVFRGLVVEAIVASVLQPDWKWCSTDYAAWDFIHESGVKLEVKQSALLQSWQTARPSTPRWDIAARAGFWEGPIYTASPGRQADMFVFGLHDVVDGTADHRAPQQWRFFVVAARALPAGAKTIGLGSVRRLCEADARTDTLHEAVAAVAAAVALPRETASLQAQ